MQPNSISIRQHPIYGALFNQAIPECVAGFELSKNDAETLRRCWPAGEDAAGEMLKRFLKTKARSSQFADVDPLDTGAGEPKTGTKDSRIGKYKDARDRVDADTTSRLRWVNRIVLSRSPNIDRPPLTVHILRRESFLPVIA